VERLGTFGGNQAAVFPITGAPVVGQAGKIHAEAQIYGELGTDFEYSTDVVVASSVDMDLQFRISDEGRFGVQLRPDSIVFYRLLRADIPCDLENTATISHCPNWP